MAQQNGTDSNIEIADGSRRYLFHYGESFRYERLPAGTRVIYPPEYKSKIKSASKAIREAIDNPLDCPRLEEQLAPGKKITVVFDDVSTMLMPMSRDFRAIAGEYVMEKLLKAGVEDVHWICATCLHRPLSETETKRILGRKVYNHYYPKGGIYHYDAEDKEANTYVGKTAAGEGIHISKRVMESDLVIYLNTNYSTQDGGYKSVAVGVCDYQTVGIHHNANTLANTVLMDVNRSELNDKIVEIGRIVYSKLNIFTIETLQDDKTFPGIMTFMNKKERHWNKFDEISFNVSRKFLDILPHKLRHAFMHTLRSPYGLLHVAAGNTLPVHERTLKEAYAKQSTKVKGQSDIMIVGPAFIGPYNVDSWLNPLLVNTYAKGYYFSSQTKNPLTRKDGVMIIVHPLYDKWDQRHHAHYRDFFYNYMKPENDFAGTASSEAEFVKAHPRTMDAYRRANSYHPGHAYYMYYWAIPGMNHFAKTYIVNPLSLKAAKQLGWEPVNSLDEAIRRAKEFLANPESKIDYIHYGPLFYTETEVEDQ